MHLIKSNSRRVLPIAEDEEVYFDEDEMMYDEEDMPLTPRKSKKSNYLSLNQWYRQCTYENAKSGMRWLLQTAAVDLTLNVSPFSNSFISVVRFK